MTLTDTISARESYDDTNRGVATSTLLLGADTSTPGAAEASMERVFTIPWFKHDRPDEIAKYANAIKKVVARAEELVEEVAEAAATAE